MRTILRLVGAVALVLAASPALAQFNAPIRYTEGPGIKLGDSLVFHPGLDIEGRYDSNALYQQSNVTGAAYMRFIGHLDLATLPPQRLTDGEGNVTPQKIDLRVKAALSYREYLNGDDAVRSQRAFEVDAGFLFGLFPQGVFAFFLSDDFARTVTARYGANTFARDINRTNAKFQLAPGGGRLTFALQYALNFDLFEDAELAGARKLFHEIQFNAKWKILPKTAINLDVIQQIYGYTDPSGGVYGRFGITKENAKPLRIFAGMTGLITPMLSTVLRVGYGNAFYPSGVSYNSVIAQAELGLQFGPFAKLKLGYLHNFDDAIFGNYYADDAIYLNYDHLIINRIMLHLAGDYRYRRYDGFPTSAPASVTSLPSLKQHLVTIGVGADYHIKEWIYVGLGYDLQLQNRAAGPTDTTTNFFAPSFTKHQIFAKVGVSY
jgi:hypothetical protein